MRLYEIITEAFSTQTTYTDTELPDLKGERMARINSIGDAHIQADKEGKSVKNIGANYKKVQTDNPFTFKKEQHLFSPDHDALLTYIETINNHNLAQSNPFFPRVFDIEIKQAGRYEKPVIDMEPLVHFEDVNPKLLKALGNRLFIDFDQRLREQENDIANAYIASLNLRNQGIKDPQLLKALKVIDKIIDDDASLFDDIGDRNIMFRSTPTGPQLVLADPIAA